MNTPAPDYRKQKQLALTTLFGASLVLGVISAALHLETNSGLTLLASIAMIVIGFRWLSLDSAELGIRRPMWLNVAIVMAAAIFVPYYLYKTRPANRRLLSILGFFGVVFGCAVASGCGAALMDYFSGNVAAPSAV